jgi:hypothetical protein
MKLFGFILLALGFIFSALVAVVDKEMVNWALFIPAMAVGVIGVVILRVSIKKQKKGAGKVGADIQNIEKGLANIVENMTTFSKDKKDTNVYDIHRKIDELFMDDIERFLEARESIIHQYDMQSYADLMNHFAAGERYLNRSWSASADGYVDESHASIEKALEQFSIARDHFLQLQNGSPKVSE